jgi:hypothetical protein
VGLDNSAGNICWKLHTYRDFLAVVPRVVWSNHHFILMIAMKKSIEHSLARIFLETVKMLWKVVNSIQIIVGGLCQMAIATCVIIFLFTLVFNCFLLTAWIEYVTLKALD